MVKFAQATRPRIAPPFALALAMVFSAPWFGDTAAAQGAQTIALADGRAVEVLGLKTWTIGMIQDSLRKYSPADSLQTHACAVVLRTKLHFADASSTMFVVPNHPNRVVVTVREPNDSGMVHLLTKPSDTTRGRREWLPLTSAAQQRPDVFFPATGVFLAKISGMPNSQRFVSPADSSMLAGVVGALQGKHKKQDQRRALHSLAHDPNVNDRMVAALILANFPEDDESWRALAGALRENGVVHQVASNVLNALNRRPKRVNWSPMSPTVRLMLDGNGGLFGLRELIVTLSATGAGPKNAKAFLGGGANMLLLYLESSNEMLSGPARSLLKQLRGADLGADASAWRNWIQSISG